MPLNDCRSAMESYSAVCSGLANDPNAPLAEDLCTRCGTGEFRGRKIIDGLCPACRMKTYRAGDRVRLRRSRKRGTVCNVLSDPPLATMHELTGPWLEVEMDHHQRGGGSVVTLPAAAWERVR